MNNSELFEKTKQVTPGGVHSPVRSFKGLDEDPRFIKEAHGTIITDEEGKEYIDYCMSFGPLILGHSHPQVKEKIIESVHRGWSFGACEKYSYDLAKFITDRLDFVDQIRFVNSGTEAVMTALRLCRGVTGKSKIIKFNGCYHGHVDSMLIKAGSGLAGTSEASSSGITPNCAADTLIIELNDIEQLKKCFADQNDIAGVIIEPLPANNGLLPQELNYLKEVAALTKNNDALLIFDEVISGFRVAFGGMAEITGIIPDIVTYGKIIGGGMPVGAIGAKKNIMENLAPIGNVYQAGTLSANPVAMCAGLETLKIIAHEGFYECLEVQNNKNRDIFLKWFKEYNEGEFQDYEMVNYQSLFWVVPTSNKIQQIGEIPGTLFERFNPLQKVLLAKGVYFSPNPYEVGFMSVAHDDKILGRLEEQLWN